MSDPRMTGLTLMAIAVASFVGTTTNTLPSVVFFPALALFALGAVKFMRGNHAKLEEAERRAHRAVNPVIRENRHAAAHAERQAQRKGTAFVHAGSGDGNANAVASRPPTPASDAIEIDDQDGDFEVATDVSFPVEVQTGDALADQLKKLNQLMAQGVLTEEEYAVAKAKLLS